LAIFARFKLGSHHCVASTPGKGGIAKFAASDVKEAMGHFSMRGANLTASLKKLHCCAAFALVEEFIN